MYAVRVRYNAYITLYYLHIYCGSTCVTPQAVKDRRDIGGAGLALMPFTTNNTASSCKAHVYAASSICQTVQDAPAVVCL